MTAGGWRPAGQSAHPRRYPRAPADRQRFTPPRHAAPATPRAAASAAASPAELSDAAVVSRSWGIAFATLISRITGFIRIVLLAAILGAALSSAFSVANQLPNLVAALVLEATFTAIFVPVLARAERDDPDGGAAFVRRLVTLSTALLLVATTLSVVTAPLLVRLMLGGQPQVNAPLTTAFAYLLLPQVIFYGLSSVFMAILNTRNVFGAPAWAPVVNNVVAIATLGLYLAVPGELSVNPVQMGNAKLLVLGIGTTLGVAAQTAVLLIALARQRISLRPLWGIDDRLKQFGAMAAAMVLYVLISQLGLVVGNQIASRAAASGPAIYNYTWLVLMLPFGMIGVTVLTVVMPRLSRNAAADDIPAVLDDLSLAIRLTMVTLIPIVAFMTVGGGAIGTALFAYGKFGEVDAGYLGRAIALSAFTLIPYALVLLQLRVFYARQQPWTPIVIIVVITTVKIATSLVVSHVIADRELVAGYLGLANGLGFSAGAIVGYLLLRPALNPPRRQGALTPAVLRTVLVTTAASLLAGLVAYVVDRGLGLQSMTSAAGGAGALLRLLVLGLLMAPIIAGFMLGAKVPEAQAALAAVRVRLGRKHRTTAGATAVSDRVGPATSYPEQRLAVTPRSGPTSFRAGPAAAGAGAEVRKGRAVTDETAGGTPSDATTRLTRPPADNFQPDVAPEPATDTLGGPPRRGRPPVDFAGDPTREAMGFAAPRETADSSRSNRVHLIPGATIAEGRYRLLVFHGGPDRLQFWQALDTALHRQVALTFVDPEGALPADEVQDILSRTLRLSRIDMPGIARVLDVARSGAGGLVVAEWIRGGSLREVADTSPSPIGGARAMQSLAAAAEAAHRAGVSLSIDHPNRVRVSIDGDVALAFPGTTRDATPDDDIRGIGAALYALLVNRWPLAETGVPSGLPTAELDADGNPKEPGSVRPEIPFPISAAAAHAVQRDGGIRSAATLLNLLEQATAEADRTDLLAPVDRAPPPARRSRFGSAAFAGQGPIEEETRARRRKGLLVGLSVGGAIIVVALLVLAWALKGMFGHVGTGTINAPAIGANVPNGGTSQTAAPGTFVKPLKATVFSPGGGADNPDKANLAIDGDPSTAWPTDIYHDPVPFPNFKSGVGLLLALPSPTVLSAVNVNLSSTGTQIQIRSSQSATPAALSDTTELTPPTAVRPGNNRIPVNNAAPTSNVLVWISKLGTTNGESRTDIYEVTLEGTS
ncbi:MAG: murein biosynthesis integral membrane protein MurJ [Mycobacteriaceae bacterium]|nr:murein biosynthesis integral membrane protein MurJ [Mycobacteriaceae bacterium]